MQEIKKHILYLGLNDKDSKQQEISTLDAYKIAVREVMAAGYDGASITEATGIYKHESGEMVIEKTLEISILFATDAKTDSLIDRLKAVFNQETIAIQKMEIKSELR